MPAHAMEGGPEAFLRQQLTTLERLKLDRGGARARRQWIFMGEAAWTVMAFGADDGAHAIAGCKIATS